MGFCCGSASIIVLLFSFVFVLFLFFHFRCAIINYHFHVNPVRNNLLYLFYRCCLHTIPNITITESLPWGASSTTHQFWKLSVSNSRVCRREIQTGWGIHPRTVLQNQRWAKSDVTGVNTSTFQLEIQSSCDHQPWTLYQFIKSKVLKDQTYVAEQYTIFHKVSTELGCQCKSTTSQLFETSKFSA